MFFCMFQVGLRLPWAWFVFPSWLRRYEKFVYPTFRQQRLKSKMWWRLSSSTPVRIHLENLLISDLEMVELWVDFSRFWKCIHYCRKISISNNVPMCIFTFNSLFFVFKVLEAASRGFVAHGVELNPWLVAYSKFRALRSVFCHIWILKHTYNLLKEVLTYFLAWFLGSLFRIHMITHETHLG